MEISQPPISKSDVNTIFQLADSLCRLLQVREKNRVMIDDWILFVKPNYRLTCGEIYNAFVMALKRDLKDEKGNSIDLLPELSISATGKVLNAYIEWKKTDDNYNRHKTLFKKILSEGRKWRTADEEAVERQEIRNELLKNVYSDLCDNNFSADCWTLYEELFSKGLINPSKEYRKELYQKEIKKHLAELYQKAEENGRYSTSNAMYKQAKENHEKGEFSQYVINRCRSIIVSDYLKKHLESFDLFLEAMK